MDRWNGQREGGESGAPPRAQSTKINSPHLCKIYILHIYFFFFKLDVIKLQMYMFLCITFSFFILPTQKKLRPYFKLLRWTALPLTLSPFTLAFLELLREEVRSQYY